MYKKLNGLNDEECFSNVQFLHKNFSAGFGLAPTMRPLKARRGILYFAKKKGKVDKTLYGRPARARLGTPIGWAIAIN
jgi:hypothetical protein